MHVSVLKNELISLLDINPDGLYVDCTGGGGGHAAMVLENLSKNGSLLILDRDIQACERLTNLFSSDARVRVVHSNFKDIQSILSDLSIGKVDGLYADFGLSTWQLSEESRGFSFRLEGDLDMRMDNTVGESAKEVVNKYSEEAISEIIYRYGEERFSQRIAKAVVSRRNLKPIVTTTDLAAVVKDAIPAKFHKQNIHPATQTFQALRIHVNQELVAIETLLRSLESIIKPEGRVCFISFHSLEDRLVKDYLNRYEKPCICPEDFPMCMCNKVPSFKVLTKKPVKPSEAEILRNPLSRSARLRSAERLH